MTSAVHQVLKQYSTDMSISDLHSLIMSIKRAAAEDEVDTQTRLEEVRQSVIVDYTARDQRDARLQHFMQAHNVPLEEHMAAVCRSSSNLESLVVESFGNPTLYTQGRKLTENMSLYKKDAKNL
jgi:hypothetical protein